MVSIIYDFLLKLDVVPLALQDPSGSLTGPLLCPCVQCLLAVQNSAVWWGNCILTGCGRCPVAAWENVRLFQETSKHFERLTGLKPWCLLQSWLFSRGTDWRLLPLGWAVRRREKSDASCCSRREVNQQGPWFPPNSNYCLFLRLSNPTATLVKSELQGQTQRGAREQTKPVLVHRTPILY